MKRIALSFALITLVACGGGGSSSSGQPQPPSPPPPAGEQAIDPVAGPARAVAADFNTYNFNILQVANDTGNPALVAGLRALNAGSLRVPGGTLGEYWDWQRGGIRQGPYPGLPAPAPFSAEILALSGMTPSSVDRLLDEVGAPALFTANVLTASLEENIADIRAFRALGQPVTRVGIGNEEYFRLPNPSARFPTARDYGVYARDLAERVRLEAPSTRLAAIAPSPLRNTGITFDAWMSGLEASGVWPVIDAIAIHPYFDTSALTPLASPASGEAAAAAMIAHDNDYLARVEARLPAGKAIWITEWNVFEDQGAPLSGGSWLIAIANLSRAVNFMANPRVEVSSLHVAIGNRQWAAMTGADGLAIDYAAGQPRVVAGQPFVLTANGEALALLGAATRGGGTAQRLILVTGGGTRPLIGTRILGADGTTRELFVNASAAPARIRTSGRALLLAGTFDRGTVANQTLQRTVSDITGGEIALPAFSAALVERR
jgi:hypothetical protein